MKTVCFKEKLEIESDLLTSIITASNNDVRLVLNHLSMLAADKNSDLEASKKYVKLVYDFEHTSHRCYTSSSLYLIFFFNAESLGCPT